MNLKGWAIFKHRSSGKGHLSDQRSVGWRETLNSAHSLSSGDVGSRGLDLGDEHGAVTAITTEASSDGADRGERAELRGGSKGARGRRGSRRKEMVVRALV